VVAEHHVSGSLGIEIHSDLGLKIAYSRIAEA
jgi:hypothetical protein